MSKVKGKRNAKAKKKEEEEKLDAAGDKMDTKERSKLYRNRKKQYFEDLEKEVIVLRDKTSKLEDENKILQKRIKELESDKSVKSFKIEEAKSEIMETLRIVKTEEKFAYFDLPKALKEENNEIRYTLIEGTKEKSGTFGEERIKLLKLCFRMIIDNILPIGDKSLLFLFDRVPISKWLRLVQRSKVKYALDRSSTGNEIVDRLSQIKVSDKLISKFVEIGKGQFKAFLAVKSLLPKLVEVRNEIFQALFDLYQYNMQIQMYESYTKEDYINFCSIMWEAHVRNFLNPHELYALSKKPKDREIAKGDELTDDEDN